MKKHIFRTVMILVLLCICMCIYYYFDVMDTYVVATDIYLESKPVCRNIIYLTDTSCYKIYNSALYKDDKFITALNKDSCGILKDKLGLYVSYGERLYKINEYNGEREVFFDKIYPLFMDESYIFAISSENADFLKIDRKNKSLENITEIFSVENNTPVALKTHDGYSYVFLSDNGNSTVTSVINSQGTVLFTDRNQQLSENTVLYYDENKAIYTDIDRVHIKVFDFETQKTKQFEIKEGYCYRPGRTFVHNNLIYFALEKYTPSTKRTERYHDNDIICMFNVDMLTSEIVFETPDHIVGFDTSLAWTYDGFHKIEKVNYLKNRVLNREFIKNRFESIEFHTQNGHVIVTNPMSNEIVSIFK
ncbi:MAG: hypothetical protein ACI3XA_08830 [Clostridia bacterium]